MAGMLPGVECARRRRFHQSGGGSYSDSPSVGGHSWSRRSSFCLYTTNHESHLSSSSSSMLSAQQRNTSNQVYQLDEKLGGVAREAKERLDERLRTLTDKRRYKSKETCVDGGPSSKVQGDLHIEVFGLKKSASKRFNWAKFNWKALDQVECAVCLENFKAGETLVHLPCAHRFHSRCLVPWLENNAHCPCCRMGLQSFSS